MAELFKFYESDNFAEFQTAVYRIRSGPDTVFKNKTGRADTLLCHICFFGIRQNDPLYVEVLLKNGADPNKRSDSGQPLGGILNRIGSGTDIVLSLLRLLLEFGMNPNASVATLNTIAHGNVSANNVEAVRLVLACGVRQINPTNHFGWTPLDVAKIRVADPKAYGVHSVQILQEIVQVLNGAQTTSNPKGDDSIWQKKRTIAMQNVSQTKLLFAESESARAEELNRTTELKRLESVRIAEEQKKISLLRAEEERTRLELARKAEEHRRNQEIYIATENMRLAELRISEAKKKSEEVRVAEEARITEEALITEEKRLAENKRIAGSYLMLAIHNLEFLGKMQESVPEDLGKFIQLLTAQLMICSGQLLPADTLEQLELPSAYADLFAYKSPITPIWSKYAK